ncbi:MAG: hypothetical protein QOF90_901 [Acetobacteraceae bacterium]|jgi:hypothetical protein|nr:hypothetical protein [Acetobacteraceae bacterium]
MTGGSSAAPRPKLHGDSTRLEANGDGSPVARSIGAIQRDAEAVGKLLCRHDVSMINGTRVTG